MGGKPPSVTSPPPHEEENGGSVAVSMTVEQLGRFKAEAARGRSYSNRISFALALELAGQYVERQDYFAVLDALDFLEGLRAASSVVAGTQFKHRPLYPLWHAHYFTARHTPRNLILRWGLPRDDTGNTDLDRLFREVAAEFGDEPEVWPGVLLHRLTLGGFEDRLHKGTEATLRECPPGEKRGRGLTGDWIIYGKHEGQNYYLGLATHSEVQAEPERLLERLRLSCAAEFPFLFS